MKKYFIIIFIFLITIKSSYASDDCSSCSIKEAPADILQKFIENQKTVLANIKSAVWSQKDDTNLDTLEANFTRSINSIISFDWYFEDFNYIVLELTTTVPSEIRRDKTKIENQLTKVQNNIEQSIKKWYSWVQLKQDEICEWIDEDNNCTLSWSVLDVLTQISINSSNVLSLYKNSILWQNTTKEDFILVPSTFYQDMISSYNKNTLTNCSMCEGWFFKKISDSIKAISNYMKYTWKATKYWIEAWNLLTWDINKEDLEKLEKDLLEKELARQWLTKEQSQIILENLKKFNDKWWFSTENNFIINSINSWNNFVVKFIKLFDDVLIAFKDNFSTSDDMEVTYLPEEIEKKESTEIVYKDMQEMYENLNKAAWIQSMIDEKSIDKLIKIHITLAKIISNLEKTIEPAQKVCKDQCAWVWNCTSY